MRCSKEGLGLVAELRFREEEVRCMELMYESTEFDARGVATMRQNAMRPLELPEHDVCLEIMRHPHFQRPWESRPSPP